MFNNLFINNMADKKLNKPNNYIELTHEYNNKSFINNNNNLLNKLKRPTY